MPQEFWSNAIFSVTPTILIGLVFWFALRAIIRADRSERGAYTKIEAEERARRGLPVRATTASPAAEPVAEATREV